MVVITRPITRKLALREVGMRVVYACTMERGEGCENYECKRLCSMVE